MLGGWGGAIDGYLTQLRAAGAPETTIGLRRHHLTRLARAVDVGPWELTGDELVAWLAGHDWAPETRRSWRSTLRGFYAWGLAQGHLERSPADALPPVKPTPPRPRPVSHDDYTMALMLGSRRERLMVRLAGELGLRRAEVAQIHSDDLVEDLTGWSLEVHGKGGKRRLLPLPDGLASELRAHGSGYVFPGRIDGHVSAKWVGTIVGRLLPDGYSMHKLRHMFATDAYSIDRDLFTVQDLLGHASPVTTRSYVLTPDAARRSLVERVIESREGRRRARL